MHRFQSKSTIKRFRFASLLICGLCLLVPLVVVVLADAIFRNDPRQMIVAMGLGGLAVLVGILQWVVASRTRCPLCMTAVLATKGCSKHRHAQTFCGSHRLRVALAVLFRGSFTCPYCHEPSVMEVRHRAPYAHARRSERRIAPRS